MEQQRSHENGVPDFASEWNPPSGLHDRINLRFGYSTGKMGFRNYTEWSVFNSAIIKVQSYRNHLLQDFSGWLNMRCAFLH